MDDGKEQGQLRCVWVPRPTEEFLPHRRFSRCEIDSHSSRSASTFSRNMNALCEVIFRPISPRATPLLRGHHLIIASRGLAELPGRHVQWLSVMARGNGKIPHNGAFEYQ